MSNSSNRSKSAQNTQEAVLNRNNEVINSNNLSGNNETNAALKEAAEVSLKNFEYNPYISKFIEFTNQLRNMEDWFGWYAEQRKSYFEDCIAPYSTASDSISKLVYDIGELVSFEFKLIVN